MRQFAKFSLSSLLALSVLVGCNGINPLAAATHFGQLSFLPASPNSINLVNNANATSQAAPRATAPSAGGATTDVAIGAPAMAPIAMPYYGGGYWGQEYELVSTSEAKTGGYQGSYLQTLNSFVQPLVQEWASDAVLRSVSGVVDNGGINPKASPMPSGAPIQPAPPPMPMAATNGGMATKQVTASAVPVSAATASPVQVMPTNATATSSPAYYGPPQGWQFHFDSRAKRESLDFFVGSDSTLIIKQTYKERQTDLSGVKIGSAEALAIVTKAIQDKSVTANDPVQPNVYAGVGGTAVGIAVPPMKAVAPTPVNTATAISAGPAATDGSTPTTMPSFVPVPTPTYAPPVEEELYTVPANAQWNLSLNLESIPQGTSTGTRLVWNINMSYDPSSAQDSQYWYSGAYARVDATTGALLSLNRPRRVGRTDLGNVMPPTPMPYPQPLPAVSAPSGSGAASAGTTTTVNGPTK